MCFRVSITGTSIHTFDGVIYVVCGNGDAWLVVPGGDLIFGNWFVINFTLVC